MHSLELCECWEEGSTVTDPMIDPEKIVVRIEWSERSQQFRKLFGTASEQSLIIQMMIQNSSEQYCRIYSIPVRFCREIGGRRFPL